MDQQEWERHVNRLFDVLDPKNEHTQAESDKATQEFLDVVDSDEKVIPTKEAENG